MAINLTEKFTEHVDEMFTTESKKALVTNRDYNWTGAHTIKVHKVNTVGMNDYDRLGTGENSSRYGALGSVENTLEEFTLRKDRSFTFAIDKLDKDETGGVLSGASALARQQREIIIPEVDAYTYDEIIKGTEALDDAEVPDVGRVLTVTPGVYRMMKKCPDIALDCDISAEQKLSGVIALLDGMEVVKIPKNRMPENFGFMIAHPVATVAPTKLEEYKVHQDPPGISGELIEGRIVYDAFVLDNKKKAIYYMENKAS